VRVVLWRERVVGGDGDGDGPREGDESSVCFVGWRFEARNECIRREGSREIEEVSSFVRS
jgi:hypothetical protein